MIEPKRFHNMSIQATTSSIPMPLSLPTPPVDATVKALEQGLEPVLYHDSLTPDVDASDVLVRPVRRQSLNTSTGHFSSVRGSEMAKLDFTTTNVSDMAKLPAAEVPASFPSPPKPAFFPDAPPVPFSEGSMRSSLSSNTTERTLVSNGSDVDPRRFPLEAFSNAHFHTSQDIELGIEHYNKVAPSGIKEKRENCMKAPRWIVYAAASIFLVVIAAGCTYGLVHHTKQQDVKSSRVAAPEGHFPTYVK
ncbi:hypothetical protein IAR50_001706 [Cryptococcus sp. DSM 104548]